ncbi:hypothetical protein NECAME_03264 [Necator americanus]|uniref:Ribosomal protein S24/S35 mitochondrial conserved domain-containing protein n=1 Tax=Necator americanus TaxID=51031 RepID=W2T6B1_NECAM|nr:hypothetical protein NECAME_03264 [Necator americanus]ETN77164.1 hypothetical protein NECAME_03264 [Necator americanus]
MSKVLTFLVLLEIEIENMGPSHMMLNRAGTSCIVRRQSSLAEKLRAVVSGDVEKKKDSERAPRIETDPQGATFNEMFVMPKRKLRGQLLDWTAVWPAARSFASSVVPLPIRMGTRPDPEKRAPFKKQGNLELVKIPNFLHLTPTAIEKHCEAIRKFCTEFPPELIENKELAESEFPLKISYNSYVHQGTNIRDNRARVITLQVKLSAFALSPSAKEKLIRLATTRCITRKQNLDYAFYLLTVIYHESCNSPVKVVGTDASDGQIAADPNVQKFAEMWNKYMNMPETPEATREYARSIKSLLGIKPVLEKTV